MAVGLPEGSVHDTGNAHTDYALEDVFAKATGGRQHTARKANSTRPHTPAQRFLIQHFRKGIYKRWTMPLSLDHQPGHGPAEPDQVQPRREASQRHGALGSSRGQRQATYLAAVNIQQAHCLSPGRCDAGSVHDDQPGGGVGNQSQPRGRGYGWGHGGSYRAEKHRPVLGFAPTQRHARVGH